MENTKEKPIMENTEVEPIMENAGEKPIMENAGEELIMEKGEEKPIIKNKVEEPIMENAGEKSIIENIGEEPIVENAGEEQANATGPTEQANGATEQPKRAGGKGRKKVKIEKIQDKTSLMVTFSKRRRGLYSKAEELYNLTGAKAAVITFSPMGKPYTYATGTSSVDEFVNRYLKEVSGGSANDSSSSVKEKETVQVQEKEVEKDNNNKGVEGFWWEQSIEDLEMEEVEEYRDALVKFKSNLEDKLEDMRMRRDSTRDFLGSF